MSFVVGILYKVGHTNEYKRKDSRQNKDCHEPTVMDIPVVTGDTSDKRSRVKILASRVNHPVFACTDNILALGYMHLRDMSVKLSPPLSGNIAVLTSVMMAEPDRRSAPFMGE